MSQDAEHGVDRFATVATASAAAGSATVHRETNGAASPYDTVATQQRPPTEASQVPGYEIVRELGRGGMGVVYLARQLRASRLVALKMVLAGAHARPEELHRFRREIEAVAAVEHANLVPVYDVGEYQGRPYYAMPYIAGGTLAAYIGTQPQPPRTAARIVAALAQATHAVHCRGIIHRDLKPANILLQCVDYRLPTDRTTDGVRPKDEISTLESAIPMIADFGLAKTLGDNGESTVSGTVLGTPSYMAPEQAAGRTRDIGPRTDVYALGAILYQMLTGRPPFHAATPWDTIHQVIRDEPVSPRRLQGAVPADLETICLKCLSKDPARRYASAMELADDLTRFLGGEPVHARPIGVRERALKWARRRPAAAALLVVCCLSVFALAAGAIVHFSQLRAALVQSEAHGEESRRRLVRLHVAHGARLLDDGDAVGALPWFAEALHLSEGRLDEEEAHRIRIAVALRHRPRLVQLWFTGAAMRTAMFADSGRRVLTVSRDGMVQCWDTDSGAAVGQPLKHRSPLSAIAVSPDGRRIVTSGERMQVWDVDTGERIAQMPAGAASTCLSFRSDGQAVVSADNDGTIRVWDIHTAKCVRSPWQHGRAGQVLAFNPQGTYALTAADGRTARVWNVHTGEAVTPPLPHGARVVHAAFAPDGCSVVTAGADGVARVWSVPRGRPTGVVLRHRGSIRAVAFSPDSLRVVTAGEDNTARVWDATTGNALTPPLRHNGSVHGASLHRNGQLLLTVANDHIVRLWDPITARPVGSSVPAFTTHQAPGPKRWLSADGCRVVTPEDDFSVRLRDASTGEALGPLLVHGSAVLYAAFSPDGLHLVTLSDDNTARIWVTGSDKLQAPPLAHAASVYFAAFSLDSRWLLTAAEDRTVRVWDSLTGEPLTPPVDHPLGVRSAHFAANGRTVNLIALDGSSREYDLTPDARPVADLLDLSHLFAGHRVEGGRGLVPIAAEQLRQAWHRLRDRYPHDFEPSSAGK